MPKPDDVGVGTAMIVLNEKGQVLLGKRKGAHRSGHWSCPGGWLDRPDQETATAAVRETFEETGLIVSACEHHVWMTEDHPDIACRTVTLYHVTRAGQWEGAVSVMEPEKCSEWRWFDLNDLPELMFPCVPDALAKLSDLTLENAQDLLVESQRHLRSADGTYGVLDMIVEGDARMRETVPGLPRLREELAAFLAKMENVVGPRFMPRARRFRNPTK